MSKAGTAVPTWTLGWRLRRALAFAGISVQEIAAELDVDRSTVSRWANDHGTPPRRVYLREWADRCGVPFEWLTEGEAGGEPAAVGATAKPRDVMGPYRRNTVRPITSKPQFTGHVLGFRQRQSAVARMDAAEGMTQRVSA